MRPFLYSCILFLSIVFSACVFDKTGIDDIDSAELKVLINLDQGVSIRSSIIEGSDAAPLWGNGIGLFVHGSNYYSHLDQYRGSFGYKIYLTSPVTVYSFYPYNVNVLPLNGASASMPITVPVSELPFDSYQLDYMYATANPAVVSKQSPTTILTFHHVLSRVSFVIKKGANFFGTGTLTNFRLGRSSTGKFKTITTGSMNISNGNLSGMLNTDSLKFTGNKAINISTGSSTTVDALVLPIDQIDTYNFTAKMVIDGIEYTAVFPAPGTVTSWAANTHYTYTLTVNPGNVSVGSVVLNNWTTPVNTNVSVN